MAYVKTLRTSGGDFNTFAGVAAIIQSSITAGLTDPIFTLLIRRL